VLDFSKVESSSYVMYNHFGKGFHVACDALTSFAIPDAKRRLGVGFWWAHEMADVAPLAVPFDSVQCDRHFHKPALIFQTDFPTHIYHHFTSVFNVWLSKHIAGLGLDPDVHIIFFDSFNVRRPVTAYVISSSLAF